MKKLMCLLLAIIISCSTIAGCDWGDMSTTTPTSTTHPDATEIDEIISKMKWDYLQKNNITNVSHDEVFIEHCAGLYNGYLVAMVDATRHVYEKNTVNVGGVDFTYFDTNRLIAYKDGEFLTLDEAFENGILSNADLVEIEAKFSAEKTYYYEFCDIHDYPTTGMYEPYLFNYEMNYTSDRLKVVLHYGGELPPVSFYDANITNQPTITEIIDLSGEHKHYFNKLFFVEIVFDKEYPLVTLATYAAALVQKPGVLSVDDIWPLLPDSDNTTTNTDYNNQ